MRRLAESGIRVALSVMPVLPALTDVEADLDELLARARAAGVRRLGWNTLFLRSPTREKYLRWLAAEFPRYLEAYQRAYSGRVYLGGRYRRWIDERLARLAARHGFSRRDDEPAWIAPPRAQQLDLW
jgi:DNA repair photolyase